MINNLEIIKPLLVFPNKDCFYFIQILQRKKDHVGERLGGSNNNSRLIKAYYVTSVEKLEVQWEEMVKLSEIFNARISINLNPRNFKKAAFAVLRKIADQMSNEDWYSIRKSYDSVCGEYHSEIDKRWIIDVDKEDMSGLEGIKDCINTLQQEIKAKLVGKDLSEDRLKDYKILAVIPSKSGCHIITNPFNLAHFSFKFPSIEVHKNNPTNLYIP